MNPKILTIHASTGNGHISAAVAIDVELKKRGIESRVVDGLDFAPIAFRTWYGGGYEACVRNKPDAWGWLYRISDRPGFAFKVQTLSDEVFLAKLSKYIAEYRPDVVVCTHSLPQPKLAALRKKFGFKMAVVVTDLYPHLMWHRGEPDWFFVPQEWSVDELRKRMPEAVSRTTVTGIPVHSAFSTPTDRNEARERLGLDPNLPVAVLTSGGIGAGDFVGAAASLARIKDLQAVIVTGRNDRAYDKVVASDPKGEAAEVRILKRVPVEVMADYIHATDMLIGKPGGLTVSEALAAGTPFVVHGPFMIPGQEEDNARFLVEGGMGVVSESNEHLRTVVEDLVRSPEKLAEMRGKAKAAGKPDAAALIVDQVLELVPQ